MSTSSKLVVSDVQAAAQRTGTNITLRAYLVGSVDAFCEANGLGALGKNAVIVELVVALARYVEEGAQMYPDVYLFSSYERAMKFLPGNAMQMIGESTVSEDFVKQSLKRCAPLAVGGWKVYLEIESNIVRYGVFHGDLNSLAVSTEDALFGVQTPDVAIARIHKIAEDCVEIRSSTGHRHNIYLSSRRATDLAPNQFLTALVTAVCATVTPDILETVQTYTTRVLRDALRDSHGCLVAVCTGKKVPAFLRDGAVLLPPIDLPALVRAARMGEATEAELKATATLMGGMFNSDGIVVFSRAGRVLAYNCFVKRDSLAIKTTVGGARRRAFETLCTKLGRGLAAVFIQSQDGWTDLREKK